MHIIFTHSHAFPGGRVTVEDEGDAGPGCLVEFGDGVTVMAEWREEGEDMILAIPAYRTAKGTDIEPHRWRLARDKDGVWRSRPIAR
ncbi:MAG: hypothetical protein QM605_16055 [Sphingobium sp.]